MRSREHMIFHKYVNGDRYLPRQEGRIAHCAAVVAQKLGTGSGSISIDVAGVSLDDGL
jgi:hypothetical protein